MALWFIHHQSTISKETDWWRGNNNNQGQSKDKPAYNMGPSAGIWIDGYLITSLSTYPHNGHWPCSKMKRGLSLVVLRVEHCS